MSYDANNVLFPAPVIVPVKEYTQVCCSPRSLKTTASCSSPLTRRLSKPSVRQLNSTTDFSDPSNYNKGNPGLRPESITNLELDYSKTWHKHVPLPWSSIITRINNALQIIETDPVNNETTTIPENLNNSITHRARVDRPF